MQNHLDEFFAMVDFCNPGVLGTPSQFRRYYEVQRTNTSRHTSVQNQSPFWVLFFSMLSAEHNQSHYWSYFLSMLASEHNIHCVASQ